MLWFKKNKDEEVRNQEMQKQSVRCGCNQKPSCPPPCPPCPPGRPGATGPRGPRGPEGRMGPVGPTGATAPSIYAQQGKCRNHAAFSTLQTIKQPL